MRKLTLILAVLLLATPLVQATEFGVTGGLNMANMTGDYDDNKSMIAFGGGTYARLSLVPQFSIQAEVLYMQKGTKWDDGDEKLTLSYLEVPVLLMFNVPTPGPVSPKFFAGPYFGYLLDAKDDFEGEELDVKEAFKDFDIGVVLGAGVDLKVGPSGKVFFNGRYSRGMSNVNDILPDMFSVKHGVLSFFVGYSMGVGP